MLNMDVLLRGMENAVLICPVLFPFPLLALHGGQEEGCCTTESRKHRESLQIALKDKTKNTRILCVCACVFDLLFTFLKRGKKHLIFDLFIGVSLCLCPNTFISYSVDVKISLCVFLSDFILWSCVFVLCSVIKWCFSLSKKVIIAFEHDLFFHQNSCCLSWLLNNDIFPVHDVLNWYLITE